MKNKIILITGSTDGIGKQTALELAEAGFNVIIHGRNKAKGEKILSEIKQKTGNYNLDLVIANFSSIDEVKNMAAEISKKYEYLNVLINNAGIYLNHLQLSKDGYEKTFAVNHLAPFLLTIKLIPLLKNSGGGRVINVNSAAHQRGKLDLKEIIKPAEYNAYGAYANSKLANMFFTKTLAEKLYGKGITVNSLHPGVIGTKLLFAGFSMSGGTLEEGAETPVYLAVSQQVDGITGKYFKNKKEASAASALDNERLAQDLWSLSEDLTGIKF